MGNFIEELYYGNIDPQARGYRPKGPVKKVSDSLNGLEEKLTKQLAGENKELFLRFCNAYAFSELRSFLCAAILSGISIALKIAVYISRFLMLVREN